MRIIQPDSKQANFFHKKCIPIERSKMEKKSVQV